MVQKTKQKKHDNLGYLTIVNLFLIWKYMEQKRLQSSALHVNVGFETNKV